MNPTLFFYLCFLAFLALPSLAIKVQKHQTQLLASPTLDDYNKIAFDPNFTTNLAKYKEEYGDEFDFTNDGCSVPKALAVLFIGYITKYDSDFLPACIQHDFGYRNSDIVGLDEYDARLQVDEIFRDNMLKACEAYPPQPIGFFPNISPFSRDREECQRAAEVYFRGVRVGGATSWQAYAFPSLY